MEAIAVSNLSKTFPARRGGVHHRALSRVSLSLERGEMAALIGASGSGKSTLIRHLCGLLVGDRGGRGQESEVRVNGRTVQSAGRLSAEVRRLRAGVAVIFQQFNLVNRLSLLDNVLLGNLGRIGFWRGTLGRFSRAERLAAMEALARVGMAEYATQRASTLSGGQQQRGAIARALVQRAQVILADEPIASLDPESARRVMESLARINREDGTTVVVSLHQVAYAKRYCRRAIALKDGELVYDGAPLALDAAALSALYGGQSEELIMDEMLGVHPGPEETLPEDGDEPMALRVVGGDCD